MPFFQRLTCNEFAFWPFPDSLRARISRSSLSNKHLALSAHVPSNGAATSTSLLP